MTHGWIYPLPQCLWFLDCSVNMVSCSTALTSGDPKMTSSLQSLTSFCPSLEIPHLAVLPCAGSISICITQQAKVVVQLFRSQRQKSLSQEPRTYISFTYLNHTQKILQSRFLLGNCSGTNSLVYRYQCTIATCQSSHEQSPQLNPNQISNILYLQYRTSPHCNVHPSSHHLLSLHLLHQCWE